MPSSSQKYQKVPTSTDIEPHSTTATALAAAAAQPANLAGGVLNRNSSDNKVMAITVNLPSTNSSQQLMSGDAESVTASLDASSTLDGAGCSDENKRPSSRNSRQYDGFGSITYSEWFTVGVLCFVNLINYMDRFTIAGKSRKNFFSFFKLRCVHTVWTTSSTFLRHLSVFNFE